jgi:hypothetical protein
MSDQTTLAPGGWQGEPGVPLNPEREGWHWIHRKGWNKPRPAVWWPSRNSPLGGWWDGRQIVGPNEIAEMTYLGPCLTPDEAAESEEALRFYADKKSWRHTISLGHPQIDGTTSPAEEDRGKRARAALREAANAEP